MVHHEQARTQQPNPDESQDFKCRYQSGEKMRLFSSCIYICVFFLKVHFEMLKHSHMEKIHHFVVYASEYTNICLQMSREPGAQCPANSTNVLRGLWLILQKFTKTSILPMHINKLEFDWITHLRKFGQNNPHCPIELVFFKVCNFFDKKETKGHLPISVPAQI